MEGKAWSWLERLSDDKVVHFIFPAHKRPKSFHLAATKNRHKRKVEKPLTRFAAFFAFLPPQPLFKAFYLSNIIAQGRRSASYCSLHKRVFTCQMFFGHLSQLSISLSIYFYLTTFYLSPCSTHELRQNKICCLISNKIFS